MCFPLALSFFLLSSLVSSFSSSHHSFEFLVSSRVRHHIDSKPVKNTTVVGRKRGVREHCGLSFSLSFHICPSRCLCFLFSPISSTRQLRTSSLIDYGSGRADCAGRIRKNVERTCFGQWALNHFRSRGPQTDIWPQRRVHTIYGHGGEQFKLLRCTRSLDAT